MDRAEATGWSVAAVGHVALFAALSLGLATVPRLKPPTPAPVEIEIVEQAAPVPTAPAPSEAVPAPSVAPDVGLPVEAAEPEPTPAPPTPAPPEPTPPPRPAPPRPSPPPPRASPPRPTPPPPRPVARPTPTTRPVARPTLAPRPVARPAPTPPRPVARPQPRPTPPRPTTTRPAQARPAPTRPAAATPNRRPTGSRLGSDFRRGLSAASQGTATTPRAAPDVAPGPAAGPAVEASLGREVLRRVRPHWRAPSGADAEQLRTVLAISLARDGSVDTIRVVRTTGQTDSNRGQVKLHQEAAAKAVRLAAPFILPSELYDTWKALELGFDRRLGQ